jgi:hypothetical protein
MTVMRRMLALALLVAAACSSAEDGSDVGRATLVVATEGGSVQLAVEVADTPEERATGLMGREELAPWDGMAFLWEEPTDATFWMKNTLIPLSIAFWDEDARIVAIVDMEPCDAEPCPSYEAGSSIVGAVEVRQGAFDGHGIAIGDQVELTAAAG